MLRALHFYPDRDRKLEPGVDAVCWVEDPAGASILRDAVSLKVVAGCCSLDAANAAVSLVP